MTSSSSSSTNTTTELSAYFNHKLFRSPVPIDLLYTLLDQIAIKKTKYYILDENCFRSLLYKPELYHAFVNDVSPFYHTSKAFYITRTHETINSFMTAINQICKHQGVQVEHKPIYRDGIKTHEYYIYY